METKGTTFLHLLIFQCPQCGNPMSAWTLSAMRNLEEVDGSTFALQCGCGWTENWLGAKAKRHWVEPWPDSREESKPLELPRSRQLGSEEVTASDLYERDRRSTPIGVPGERSVEGGQRTG